MYSLVCFIYVHLVMNREERLSHRRELCRLRRERETTEEREERLAKQREYMRHRRAAQMEQQKGKNPTTKKTKLVFS